MGTRFFILGDFPKNKYTTQVRSNFIVHFKTDRFEVKRLWIFWTTNGLALISVKKMEFQLQSTKSVIYRFQFNDNSNLSKNRDGHQFGTCTMKGKHTRQHILYVKFPKTLGLESSVLDQAFYIPHNLLHQICRIILCGPHFEVLGSLFPLI